MDELKKCPLCGEQHNWETGEDAHYGAGKYIVCRNRIIMQAHNDAEIDSRTAHYNTRPLEDALTAEVASLRERVAELEAEAAWMSVSERLPEVGIEVIVVVDGVCIPGWWSGRLSTWRTYGTCGQERLVGVATHWRPLPKPPEVKND